MTTRDHFVYRVIDEYGLLLYIGCTHKPENRLRQHRSDKQKWIPYMHTVRMEGPFEKKAAFAREAEAIENEIPFFNALREHKIIKRKRWQLSRRLHNELRASGRLKMRVAPDFDLEEFEAFEVESRRISAEVDAAIPDVGDAWRHANYLQARSAMARSAA